MTKMLNPAAYTGLRLKPVTKKKKPFNLNRVIEEICEREEFSPAEALIKAYQEADEVAELSGISAFDALKLKTDISKKLLDKIYANKTESKTTLSGPDGLPVQVSMMSKDEFKAEAQRLLDEV